MNILTIQDIINEKIKELEEFKKQANLRVFGDNYYNSKKEATRAFHSYFLRFQDGEFGNKEEVNLHHGKDTRGAIAMTKEEHEEVHRRYNGLETRSRRRRT